MKEYFEIENSKGQKQTCKILLNFTGNNKNYLLYTNFETNEHGDLNVFAASYEVIDNNIKFFSITNEAEWNLIDKRWKEYQND